MTLAYHNPRGSLANWLGADPLGSFFSNVSAAQGFQVHRSDNGFDLEVDVPGFTPEQVKVTLDDHTLHIEGKSERRSFSRAFSLPEEIDQDSINAKIEHGLLTLKLAFQPKTQPKEIKVQFEPAAVGVGNGVSQN